MKAAVALLGLMSALLFGTDRTFLLETQNWTPYTRTYLGSGLIGLSSSRLGTDPAESFRAGVYDHGPGDIPRLALLPAWNSVDVNNGRSWLNATTSVRGYHQTLDMYDGTLRTQYSWVDGDREMGISVLAFVSRASPDSGVIRLETTPQFSGVIKVNLPLVAWPEPKRYPLAKLGKLTGDAQNQQNIWYPGHMVPQKCTAQNASLQMVAAPEGTSTVIAEAASLHWPGDLVHAGVTPRQTNESCAIEISFQAAAGRTYAFDKYVVIASSTDSPNPLAKATSAVQRNGQRGFSALLQDSANAWHKLWQADIQIDGDPNLQTVIHSMLFYLLGSATDRVDLSIPPMGLSTAGYYGHVFWDADTFMLPVLMALHPELAKPLVMFRYRTLDAARHNASINGRMGAMYPWEAGPDGAETTPRFAYQNALAENHVNGDIALAEWQYFLATGDKQWLESYGYPVIHDTAEFWTSRVTYNKSKDRYEIHGVVSVDESKIGVTDDPYTNATARRNLEIADAAARTLGKSANPKWAGIARKLYLPNKDLLLLDYPLELPMTEAERRALVTQALKESAGRQSGVMMEVEFRPIPAVELHDRSALSKMLDNTYGPYVRPPFNVVPETPENDNINFLTGAGAFLQQFIFGYAGLRFDAERGLSRKFPPLLPEQIRRLVLHNVWVRGRRVDITVP